MKGIALHVAILAALASAALLVIGFGVDGQSASADDFILQKCPTPTPGTPTSTVTPGGPTVTNTLTSTPCIVKATPTAFAGSPTPCPTTGCIIPCPTDVPPGPTSTPDFPPCLITITVTPTPTQTFTVTLPPTLTPCLPAGCPTPTHIPCPPEGCFRPCPTATPGTPIATNTPGGSTKTATVTATPCFVTPTPPVPVGGDVLGSGPAALPLETNQASGGSLILSFSAAGLAAAMALLSAGWYAHRRWGTR